MAKLDKAPASKAGDSRFEPWLPRFPVRAHEPVDLAAYILFFLAGVAFGYAAPGMLRWLALLFPLGLALVTLAAEGGDGTLVLRLLLALLITAFGVLLGTVLDRRGAAQTA